MGGSIVKLSVLLSANASQATSTMRDFANEAQRSSLKAQTAFNGQSMKVGATNVGDMGRSVFEATRTPMEKYKSTLETLDVLKARGAINANTFSRAVAMAGQEMKQATSHGSSLLSMVGGVKGALIGATAAGFGFASVMGIKAATASEDAMVSFETLLKSTAGAKKMLAELQQFAASTPFELGQVRTAAQQMLAYGITARDILPMLRVVGDAAAAAPQGMEQGLESVTRALGQMKGKGKVSAQEMLQLTEAGINAWSMLAKGVGKSIPETQKLVEDGVVNSATGIKAILEGMQDQFGGVMKNKSKTITGMMSNLKDSLNITLGQIAADTMEALNIKGILATVSDSIQSFGNTWKSLRETVGGFFSSVSSFFPPFTSQLAGITGASFLFVNGLRMAIPPLIGGITALGVAIKGMLGPWTLVAAGITAAASAIMYFKSKQDELAKSSTGITNIRQAAAEMVSQKHGVSVQTLMDDSPTAAWKKNKTIAKDMEDAVQRASEAMGKFGNASIKEMDIISGSVTPVTEEFKKLRKELEKEIGEIGLSAEMKKIKNFESMGGGFFESMSLQALAGLKKASEERNKLMEDGKKLTQEMLSPQMKLTQEMDRLNRMLMLGAINWQTYGQAIKKAADATPLNKMMEDTKKELKDREEKARFNAEELQLINLRRKGANDEQLAMTKARQDAAKAAEDRRKWADDAKRLNDEGMSGTERAKKGLREFAELRRNGLNEDGAKLKLKQIKDDFMKDQQRKNEITNPGLALAGSQEAYKAMVASTQVNPNKSEEKIIDGMIKAANDAANKQMIADKANIAVQNAILSSILTALGGRMPMVAVIS